MRKVVGALAMIGLLASPAMAVVVQWSDFEVGTNYGLGLVGENVEAPAGYGPPTSYDLVASPKTTGNLAQAYVVPPTVVDTNPVGEGWMIPSDGGGAFDATDWKAFVQTLGGPVPDPDSPCKFIADIRIDVDVPADYDALKWFPLHNAPGATFQEIDVLGGDAAGVWHMDVEFLTTAFDGAGDLSFILILDSMFNVNNPFTNSTATFYIDNLRIEYVPEPASAMLLLLGVPFLRRRR